MEQCPFCHADGFEFGTPAEEAMAMVEVAMRLLEHDPIALEALRGRVTEEIPSRKSAR